MPHPSKRTTCKHCGGEHLRWRITDVSGRLREPPPLARRQIYVRRVAPHECQSCGHLMRSAAGRAKIERCVAREVEFFLGLIP